MSWITGFEVTVGSALGPAHYKRWVNSAGASVPLSPLSTFLWVKASSSSDEPPVTEVRVLYDDEATPEGFKKLARDVTGGGTGGRVFLAYSCAAGASQALTAVSVLLDGESPGAQQTQKTAL
jgi:hypothetical protein